MASASLKGTRKTYSFEERRILLSLINKHKIIEDRKPDPLSICKRKSAWLQITQEYNSMVEPRNARSSVQLRRCWENMKACKRNREEKKFRYDNAKATCQSTRDDEESTKNQWKDVNYDQNMTEAPTSTRNVGLPPNVIFEPKNSEPFTLQSFVKPLNLTCSKKDADSCKNLDNGAFKQDGDDADKVECDAVLSPDVSANDCCKTFAKKTTNLPVIDQSANNVEKNYTNLEPNASDAFISPSVMRSVDHNRKKKATREDELHLLALSEAQIKVDIAAMMKEEARIMLEEARIKLEEAHYRKEEARFKMLFFCSQTEQN
ncbi:uncharacterized protein LOC109855586 [Pseudomyrmex gracilis]|uniref:uncharacterized protein LOC109855586 n=1 Tax=Pseudomyrmex gracilis TaxID=219809 RepID=UPI000994B6B2|nr:uncharacterized protein LOC109855586 [Pseudomyrmex gracilis]